MRILETLYVNSGGNEVMVENIEKICEVMAMLIVHEETRIS